VGNNFNGIMMKGIINCFKPEGITSFSLVRHIRKLLSIKKAGHGGTLDPIAVGVLPVFIGKATRLIEYQGDLPKVYRAEMLLGARTDTQDKTGVIIEKKPVPKINVEELREVFLKFTGKVEQIPPMYSALKHQGHKLYELARKGIEIDRLPRTINIYKISLLEPYNEGSDKVCFEVECSSGTYIRTLCEDIGYTLKCGAYLNSLTRISSGAFHISSSHTLDEISSYYMEGNIQEILLPPDYAVKHLPSVSVLPEFESAILNGRTLYHDQIRHDQIKNGDLLNYRTVCVYNDKKELLAITGVHLAEDGHLCLKPLKVMR
jgi:tRNA pseudouridine55 synthase